MTSRAERAPPARPGTGTVASAVLILAMGGGTVIAAYLGSASPILALLPLAVFTGAFAIGRVPLRFSAAGLLALLLVLDVSSDSAGIWHTPFVALGDLLRDNLPGLRLSGLELVFLGLLAAWFHRRARGSTGDTSGNVGTASVVRDFILLYVAALVFANLNGVLRGNGLAVWKLRNNAHVILFFLLFSTAIRGPQDFRLFGRIVVLSAVARSLLAIWVQYVVAPEQAGGHLAFATNHGDSILFTVAAVTLIAHFTERPDGRRLVEATLLLPVILLGMVANGRRLAWVVLAFSLLAWFALSPRRPWKRRLLLGFVAALPILAIYVGVGWNSSSGVFAPVQSLRSVTDGTVDRSTLWREVENWNISMSIRQSPFLGIGLGGEYSEFMPNDDISAFYPDFRGWPHNSVLGLLLFAGVFAFTAMWSLFAIIVFLGVRSYRLTSDPAARTAVLACLAAVIACMGVAYGDTGANLLQFRVFWGLSLAVVAKLAVSTGAWPARKASLRSTVTA